MCLGEPPRRMTNPARNSVEEGFLLARGLRRFLSHGYFALWLWTCCEAEQHGQSIMGGDFLSVADEKQRQGEHKKAESPGTQPSDLLSLSRPSSQITELVGLSRRLKPRDNMALCRPSHIPHL